MRRKPQKLSAPTGWDKQPGGPRPHELGAGIFSSIRARAPPPLILGGVLNSVSHLFRCRFDYWDYLHPVCFERSLISPTKESGIGVDRGESPLRGSRGSRRPGNKCLDPRLSPPPLGREVGHWTAHPPPLKGVIKKIRGWDHIAAPKPPSQRLVQGALRRRL